MWLWLFLDFLVDAEDTSGEGSLRFFLEETLEPGPLDVLALADWAFPPPKEFFAGNLSSWKG